MPAFASHDENHARLYNAGWTVGDILRVDGDGDYIWLVIGFKGKNTIRTQAESRDAAWHCACDQAAGQGLL
jgi:hypothetical protein